MDVPLPCLDEEFSAVQSFFADKKPEIGVAHCFSLVHTQGKILNLQQSLFLLRNASIALHPNEQTPRPLIAQRVQQFRFVVLLSSVLGCQGICAAVTESDTKCIENVKDIVATLLKLSAKNVPPDLLFYSYLALCNLMVEFRSSKVVTIQELWMIVEADVMEVCFARKAYPPRVYALCQRAAAYLREQQKRASVVLSTLSYVFTFGWELYQCWIGERFWWFSLYIVLLFSWVESTSRNYIVFEKRGRHLFSAVSYLGQEVENFVAAQKAAARIRVKRSRILSSIRFSSNGIPCSSSKITSISIPLSPSSSSSPRKASSIYNSNMTTPMIARAILRRGLAPRHSPFGESPRFTPTSGTLRKLSRSRLPPSSIPQPSPPVAEAAPAELAELLPVATPGTAVKKLAFSDMNDVQTLSPPPAAPSVTSSFPLFSSPAAHATPLKVTTPASILFKRTPLQPPASSSRPLRSILKPRPSETKSARKFTSLSSPQSQSSALQEIDMNAARVLDLSSALKASPSPRSSRLPSSFVPPPPPPPPFFSPSSSNDSSFLLSSNEASSSPSSSSASSSPSSSIDSSFDKENQSPVTPSWMSSPFVSGLKKRFGFQIASDEEHRAGALQQPLGFSPASPLLADENKENELNRGGLSTPSTPSKSTPKLTTSDPAFLLSPLSGRRLAMSR